MSRQSSLFKYFGTPSPKTASRAVSKLNLTSETKENNKSDTNVESAQKAKRTASTEDEEISKSVPRKRIKMIVDSDTSESETEEKPPKKQKVNLPSKQSKEKEVSTKKSKSPPIKEPKPTEELLSHQVLNNLRTTEVRDSFMHSSLPFLQPDKIKDRSGRRPSDPEYDQSTVYVPKDFIDKQTPGMQQWWELKSQYYDTVLFFKVGKFYELYHMDAVIGVEDLGFSYMKSNNWAHSGFPEQAYGRMAACLIEKGYKVARVEQTETPEQMQERSRTTPGKKIKVVRREICQVTTKATQVFGVQDTSPTQPTSVYLLAITELVQSAESSKTTCTYGVCFVETSLGKFHIGQFQDDIHRSGLFLMISHFPPALILYPKGEKSLSQTTQTILNASFLSGVKKQPLIPKKQFLTAEDTLKFIQKQQYFNNEDGDLQWPKIFEEFCDTLSHSCDLKESPDGTTYNLALSALGAVAWFLNYSKIDHQLLSMRNFTKYSPNVEMGSKDTFGTHMILDAVTIHHLRIIDMESSLYDKVNFCKTPFGKRLLRQWVCSPLCNIELIRERQEAIEELIEAFNTPVINQTQEVLAKIPDLERLVASIHTMGNKVRSTTHPDSRAIMFEGKIYTKKKILDFCATLDAFEQLHIITKDFSCFKSKLIARITQTDYPDLRKQLKFFKKAFDQESAKASGTILPSREADEAYDAVLTEIDDISNELESYRKSQESFFKCKIVYVGTDRKRFQLEIPVDRASKVTSEYHLEGTRKGFKRYSTPETKQFLSQMQAAEEKKRLVLQDLARKLFEKFGDYFEEWTKATYCISILDVLMSLAQYTTSCSYDMCFANFVETGEPSIHIVDGRHPTIATSDFIPNDSSLGLDGSQLLVLTGPNMGGKSTLMRQVALITILAQIGCQVPASECSLSIVDRIFTRIGARDEIMQGSSTFLVELQETNSILKHATRHSLALLDELGRGTSTHDGSSIAGGVVKFLATRKIRTIISTHYHQLIDAYKTMPNITLGHMSCIIDENENKDENVTFLYKYAEGACPKSYGFNAARLAGLPSRIISKGLSVSRDIELEIKTIRKYLELMQLDNLQLGNFNLGSFLSDLKEIA